MDSGKRKGEFKEVDYNDLMVLAGFGKGHWCAMLASGLLIMYVLCDTMGMSIVSPASTCDFETTEIMKSGIEAASFLGIIFSSYLWGYETDISGRRYVLLRATAMAIFCSWCSMLMTNYWFFVLFRFLTGIFLAGPGFAALTYFGEFCTHANRAILINYMSMFAGLGMLYCPGLGELLMYDDWYIHIIGDLDLRPWRLLGFCITLPGVISLLLLLKLPESPKFLLAVGKTDEAIEAANWICRLNTGKDLREDFNVGTIKPLANRVSVAQTNLARQMLNDGQPLFQEPFAKRFMLSCATIFGLLLVANGMGIWFTDMRNRVDLVAAYEDNKDWTQTSVCVTMTQYKYPEVEADLFICIDSFKGFMDSIRMGITFIIEYQLLGFVLLYKRRKPVFVGALCVCGCCGLSLTFLTHPELIRVAFLIFLSIPPVLMSLLGGAVLEGKGMCICLIVGRTGAVVGMVIMGTFLETHCVLVFIFFGSVPFICAVIGYFLPLDAHLF